MLKHGVCLFVVLLLAGLLSASQRPNVVLIVTDDQGYGDVSAHGNPELQTPNLDALHRQSLRLTDFHVDPTCAPTRAAVMTGKYSHHAGVWHTVRGGNHLRRGEVTMAEVFKENGYATALFGKWHLGANYPYRPMDRGFDEWLGIGDGGPGTSDDYFWNDRVNDVYWHNGEQVHREGYNPDVFFDAALDYIKGYNEPNPFFVYLPTYAPHDPCTLPDPGLANKYLDAGTPKGRALFYAMIERVDQNVGKLLETLDGQGLADDTIVIFMTDNGSTHGRSSFNAGMSGGKGSTQDGGHRVPCFIRWPSGDLGEARDIDTLSAHIDLLPTLTELCGLELHKKIDFDGTSLVPLMKEEESDWPERTLFVEVQRKAEYEKGWRSAVLTQRWRLLSLDELYDIKADPAQKNNVSAEYPEVVEQLRKRFDDYWALVTPEDRVFPLPIVGTEFDEEVYLGVSELREGTLWNHAHTASGKPISGLWHFEVETPGAFEIEIRRWPKEVDGGTISGVPPVTKTVDAWDYGPKTHLLYGDEFVALPIKEAYLRVGDVSDSKQVTVSDESLVFEVELGKGLHELDAIFLDEAGKRLTSAYHVYIRRR
ncbi:arylsulfatase [Pelagicoccus mobilis]|uniref:Arylsulfatase n=1 Tax=Pelagicoccus mobilis TaxID=415221 RepID=A0A934S4R3_9BACT|nr:arylsulfatase [Pelagicoccus mobilis]MBK1878973.1 arylsulfatase [Pelagicoccus mobilis]